LLAPGIIVIVSCPCICSAFANTVVDTAIDTANIVIAITQTAIIPFFAEKKVLDISLTCRRILYIYALSPKRMHIHNIVNVPINAKAIYEFDFSNRKKLKCNAFRDKFKTDVELEQDRRMEHRR
jgi:hypothetical protein